MIEVTCDVAAADLGGDVAPEVLGGHDVHLAAAARCRGAAAAGGENQRQESHQGERAEQRAMEQA